MNERDLLILKEHVKNVIRGVFDTYNSVALLDEFICNLESDCRAGSVKIDLEKNHESN